MSRGGLALRGGAGPVRVGGDGRRADGVVRQVSAKAEDGVAPGGVLGLRVPAHNRVQDVLGLSAGPVVMAGAPGGENGSFAITAQQVQECHGK